jgi:hypothetical protein
MVAVAVGEVAMAEVAADMAVGEAGIIRTERRCTLPTTPKKQETPHLLRAGKYLCRLN